jgi:DNA-binding NarL/FixJ family response regulator
MKSEIKILIADDHYLIAKLIKMMLITAQENYIVELAKSSTEVFDYLKKHKTDLILLDIDMPEIDGLQVLKKAKIEYPETKILMISNHTEAWIIKRALKLGADGYISKYADSDEILNAIKSILKNENYLCKNTIKSLYLSSNTDKKEVVNTHIKNALGNLSKRELEVLKLVVEEYSTKEISELLFISTRTVETHRKNILTKLGVKNTLSLIKLFMETNMTETISEI